MLLQPLISEGQSKDFGCLAKQIGWSAAHEFLVESDARSTPLSRYSVPVAGRGSTGEMSFATSGFLCGRFLSGRPVARGLCCLRR
jgi:hypothetical protein